MLIVPGVRGPVAMCIPTRATKSGLWAGLEMELSARGYHLPIACRFVPNDQWLVTHLNTSWKIFEVKHWLLTKCLPTLFAPLPDTPRPAPKRAVSPITFARRDELGDGGDDGTDVDHDELIYEDDEALLMEDSLHDHYKYVPPRQASSGADPGMIPKTTTPASLPQYTLLSFSTGQILEDHHPLSWYTVYPHELFELHLHNSIVKLPRHHIEDYVKPYFEARVWALRVISKDDDGNLGISRASEKMTRGAEVIDYEKDRMLKKRRTKLQWQEKWVVIHSGVFQLCKDRNERVPTHSAQLSALVALRGADHLRHMKGVGSSSLPFASPPSNVSSPQPGGNVTDLDNHIICAKFRRDGRVPGNNSPWWRRGSRDAGGSEDSRKNSTSGADALSTEEDGGVLEDDRNDDHVVVVMKMLDECSYNNILRILHRHEPASSTFLPQSHRMRSPRRRSYSPISFASGSGHGTPTASPERRPRSPSLEPLPPPRSVRYPEWRQDLVRRARRAGLGDVGRAMEIIMFGRSLEEIEQTSSSETSGSFKAEEERRGRSRTWSPELDSDNSSGNGDESTSEKEWEGWEGDLLSRRARRDTSDEPDLTWAGSWVYASSGFTVSPNSDYTFPPSLSRSYTERDSLSSVPRKTLSSYSSADSLLRRTIKRASPRKRRPIPGRSDSPSLLSNRARPRSPLADYSDNDDDEQIAESPLIFEQPPQVAYPSRQSSFESSISSRSGYHTNPRLSLPISMAMTTITSTVSVGDDVAQDKKGKGKAKARDKSVQQPTRRRSSTVQAPLTSKSKPPQVELSQPSALQQRSPRAGPSGQSQARAEADSTESKPARLKLSLSFAQVAALGTLTASSGRLPSSPTSGSSFESPRFARPEDSD